MDSGFSLWDPEVIGIIDLTANKKDCFGELMTWGGCIIGTAFEKKEGEAWPFDKPYYLILNVAYGGWGGSCGMDDSAFPCEMKVDWIRYYKLKEWWNTF